MECVKETTRNAVREFAEPVIATVKEDLREARRAVAAGRQAVEDRADDVRIKVRRHPFAAVGIAMGAGMLLGCAIGFTAGRRRDLPPG